jgi:F-type H+-transporting ATPase subunit b
MPLDPIAQINVTTLVATFAIFLITFLVLRKVFFIPVIEVLERRDAKLENGRDLRAAAQATLVAASEEAQEIKSSAVTERERVFAEVRAATASEREASLAKARAQAEKIVAAGREDITAREVAERAQMKGALIASVTETLSKIVEGVDEQMVNALVESELAAQADERAMQP